MRTLWHNAFSDIHEISCSRFWRAALRHLQSCDVFMEWIARLLVQAQEARHQPKQMTMTRSQKLILILWLVVTAAVAVFPPWTVHTDIFLGGQSWGTANTSTQFRPLFAPSSWQVTIPDEPQYSPHYLACSGTIRFDILTVELFILSAVAVVSYKLVVRSRQNT